MSIVNISILNAWCKKRLKMVTQLVRNGYPHLAQSTEKHSRKKGQFFAAETEWVFSCHGFQSSPPDQLLISSGARGMLILAVNVGGVKKCGQRRRGGRVQSSLQKQPASTVEERRFIFDNASRSAITSGKSSSTVLFSSSCPCTVGGDLPAITTSFPEFLWLSGTRMRMVPGPHCQDWGGKLFTSARSCIAEPLWLYVSLIRIRSCCCRRTENRKLYTERKVLESVRSISRLLIRENKLF